MTDSANGLILVCFAVKEEAAPFLRALPCGVETLITGMGAAAAERAFTARLNERPWQCVFTCGFAGGLNPALRPETIVCDTDGNFPLRQALLDAGAVPGSFCHHTRVLTTAVEKRQAREDSRADAVEMESEVIRRICHLRGIPSATVRVISDAADEEMPLDFNPLMDADGKLNLGKLALAVLRRPQKIPALLTLGRRTKSAAARLAAVLRATLTG
ncbi:MAG: hypothetical protein ABMA26_13175 [Limisphaerales bacterium]